MTQRLDTDAYQDRIKGVLVGQAAADALGVHYELGTPSHMNAQMLGGGYGFAPYQWSDDTEQAAAIAEAAGKARDLAPHESRADAAYIEQAGVALVRWYQRGPADVGPTAGAVLGRIRVHPNMLDTHPQRIREHLELAARQNYEQRGRPDGAMSNGSLMRTNPAILPYLGRRAQGANVVRAISNLTHADPMAGDAAVLWSLAVEHAVHLGERWNVQHMLDGLHYLDENLRPVGRWQSLITEAAGTDPHRFRPNLAVVKAFQAALSTVVHTRLAGKGYEYGVQLAIDIGGDTDTVAAIAGGLLGAIYGASAIPGDWSSKLHGMTAEGRLSAAELGRLALDAAGELVPKVAE
jgi:ADP-ribosylglycohydrolase